LVWTNADLFVFLRAGVPQVKLIGHVTAEGVAFAIEQRDAVWTRSVEPVVRLTKHLRHEQLHARHGGEGELIRVAPPEWTSSHGDDGHIEYAVQIGAVMHGDE